MSDSGTCNMLHQHLSKVHWLIDPDVQENDPDENKEIMYQERQVLAVGEFDKMIPCEIYSRKFTARSMKKHKRNVYMLEA